VERVQVERHRRNDRRANQVQVATLPRRQAADSYLRYSRWEGSGRVAERRRSRCGFQLGDATVRAGENRRTAGSGSVSPRDSGACLARMRRNEWPWSPQNWALIDASSQRPNSGRQQNQKGNN
jgi:hypothetical protein